MSAQAQGPHGEAVQVEGWSPVGEEGDFGWAYTVPTVVCQDCSTATNTVFMEVRSARVVGGRYALIWLVLCPVCGHPWEYPAADMGEEG